MRIIHAFPFFRRFGGAQKVILNLHKHFSKEYDTYLFSFQDYISIHEIFKARVKRENYLSFRFSNLKKIKNSVVFSHDRKMTFIFMLLRFFFSFRLIHVAHGVYYKYSWATLFPKKNVAVSEAVKKNLVTYFRVKNEHVQKIYNGVEDQGTDNVKVRLHSPDRIRILFLGQIDQNKQQIKVVQELKSSLDPKIVISFAGEGNDAERLNKYIQDHSCGDQFKYIGFQTNIPDLISEHDYVMLFSKNEGLGISLIESCMMGRPIITKASGGSAACGEICVDGYNGFVANNFDELRIVLNRRIHISSDAYLQLCFNARQIYNKNFRIETMETNYSLLLSNLILKY